MAYVTNGETTIIEKMPSIGQARVIKTPMPNPFYSAEERDTGQIMRHETEFHEKTGQHERVSKLIKMRFRYTLSDIGGS